MGHVRGVMGHVGVGVKVWGGREYCVSITFTTQRTPAERVQKWSRQRESEYPVLYMKGRRTSPLVQLAPTYVLASRGREEPGQLDGVGSLVHRMYSHSID